MSNTPQIQGNELIIQDPKGNVYGFALNDVCKYNDNTVVIRKHDLYFVWKYGIEHSLSPAWHCHEISSHWLTIIYA
jgi:hypothetical protein